MDGSIGVQQQTTDETTKNKERKKEEVTRKHLSYSLKLWRSYLHKRDPEKPEFRPRESAFVSRMMCWF
jgi:hypothetical protein